jgi:hypothetical protein
MERCDECGFDYQAPAEGDIADTLRKISARYVEILSDHEPEKDLRTRPAPDVWSAVEYACHVRDVLLIQRDRVILALVEDKPDFARMYRDERAELANYRQEPLGELTEELTVAANLFARVFERLSAEQMARPCIYNFPRATERDVEWLGRHTLHEAVHHLGDVQAVLTRVSS